MVQQTLCLFQKRISEVSPASRQVYMTKYKDSILHFNVKHDYYSKYYFLPSTVIGWNNLDSNIGDSESLALFKKGYIGFHNTFRK